MRHIAFAFIVLTSDAHVSGQSTGYADCDRYIDLVRECMKTKMPEKERAARQQQIDGFREMLANPFVGAALAKKCGENIQIEMQRNTYGCYTARAAAAGVPTACSLVQRQELASLFGQPYRPGRPGNSKCFFAPRASSAPSVTVEVTWSHGREQMDVWRKAVADVRHELRRSIARAPIEGVTLPGIAEDAFFFSVGLIPSLAVRHGDVAITVQGPADREHLIALAKNALGRLQ